MRKRIIGANEQQQAAPAGDWVDVQSLARVEISSEDSAYPIEAALLPEGGRGWHAATPGPQTIRLLFDTPLSLRRLRRVFHEAQAARTQEFTLRWSDDGGRSYREIVRQQYTFSPAGATREVEDYTVNLDGVTALELAIVPDISGGDARAALTAWLIG